MNTEQALDRIGLLRELSSEDRARIVKAAELVRRERGESFWQEGRPSTEFSFVVRGHAKLARATEAGRDTLVEVAGPGELLCGSTPTAFAPYCCSAVAVEDDTEVLRVPRPLLLELFERHPRIAQALLQDLACRGIRVCGRVEEMSSGQVPQRIAKVLLRLADHAGIPRAGGAVWVPIPLSRQDLADFCGTTVETAIRVMSRWARDAVVLTAARGFVVADRARLEAAARGLPELAAAPAPPARRSRKRKTASGPPNEGEQADGDGEGNSLEDGTQGLAAS